MLQHVSKCNSLYIVHHVLGVGHLVDCCIANKALCVSESHAAGHGAVALIVYNDLHAAIMPDTHASASQADKQQLVTALITGPPRPRDPSRSWV